MAAIPKEERLFLELGKRQGVFTPEAAEAALARARAADEETSVVGLLLESGAVSFEAADAIRQALFKQHGFTCPECQALDFVELDEARERGRLCGDCQRKKSGGAPAAKPAPSTKPAPSAATPRPAQPPASRPTAKPPSSPAIPRALTLTPSPSRPPGAAAAPPARPAPLAPPSGGLTTPPPPSKPAAPSLGRRSSGSHAALPASRPDPRATLPAEAFDVEKTVAEPGFDVGKTVATIHSPVSGTGAKAAGGDAKTPAGGLVPGQVLGGCRVEKQIGQGGMGRVFKGFHQGLDRSMAVKILDDKLVARAGFVDQFFVEARTLAKLDHPNVVRVFNVDKDENGIHFIVMELLEGGSVEALWKKEKKRLPVDEAVRIAREAAAGLLSAHQAGLIHRDVKPGNLMLTGEGRVKVVDFGLAVPTQNDFFVATQIAGTPLYMAPEQCDGLRLDARCDQYALGTALYQLLCGVAPFEHKKGVGDILVAHMGETPRPPRDLREDVPVWLEGVILKMIAKKPGERYPSLESVLAALEAGERGEVPEAAAPREKAPPINLAVELAKLEKGRTPRAVAPPRWRPALVAAGTCAGLALGFVLGPAREAFAGPGGGWGDVPASVARTAREAEALANKGRPEEIVAAIARLDLEIADLGPRAGAGTLDALAKNLRAKLDSLRGPAGKSLEERVASLAARPGAAIEAADPESPSLVALGLAPLATKLRGEVAARLAAEKGEVYVPGAGEARGFYLDRTEVTNEAYAAAVAAHGLTRPSHWPAGKLPAALEKKPATGVSLAEAQAYAKALGKRLPTPAEHERAIRGSDGRAYPWGPRFEVGRANTLDGGSGALEDVGSRAGDRSPAGALDLAGNALEWLASERPCVSGGGLRSSAESARAGVTFPLDAATRHPGVGFRCARDREP